MSSPCVSAHSLAASSSVRRAGVGGLL